jgi:hypothetical protein
LVDVREYDIYPLQVPEHQEEKESRRLWAKVIESLKSNNMDMATDEKLKVEDHERVLRKEREQNDIESNPRFFIFEDNDDYSFKGLEK